MFYKILCPTDFSEASYKGLQVAADLALRNDAELCILHVITPSSSLDSTSISNADYYAEIVVNICAVIEKKVPVEVHSLPLLKRGEVIQEIRQVAAQEKTDLIVLTTHGAGATRQDGLGTVTEMILRTVSCPVLTINAGCSSPATCLN